MKTCLNKSEFEADWLRLLDAVPDDHSLMEQIFQLLGDYASGLSKVRFQVDRLDSETRVLRFMAVQNGSPIFLVIPFLETEHTFIFLRMHMIELPNVMAA
ncbi:MAG: hypothetical protein JWM68_5417 [Verrucomicrobiales bacterium]|nr:hypothetical protein [Verrucomicrobiales bacterium]